MLHPRDRYRREPNNICLEIVLSLIVLVIIILICVCLVLAVSKVSSKTDDTKTITSEHSAHNNTVSLKTISLQKQNVTFSAVVLETKTIQKTVPISLIEAGRKGSVTRTSTVESWHSLARKGRYMKRALLKNNKDD